MLPKTPPGRVLERDRGKVGFRSVSGTPPYGYRTIISLVLAQCTRCLRTRFWLYCCFVLRAGHFWVPKMHKRFKKMRTHKHINTKTSKIVSNRNQKEAKSRPNPNHVWHLFPSLGPLGPRMGPGTHFGSIFHRNCMVFRWNSDLI